MIRVPVGIDIILNQLETPDQSLILDAGAGTGNYTFELCCKVKKVVSIENSDGMIE